MPISKVVVMKYAKLGQREEDEGEGRAVAIEEIHVGSSGIELLQVA